MQKEKEIELLLNREQIPYRKGEPMKDHTSFHIGGGAAFFVTPRTEAGWCSIWAGIFRRR